MVNIIIKWLFRGILGLIILLLVISVVLHLPPVQSMITTKASKFLTETTGGEVSIGGIHFSTWNGITIENLHVSDPQSNEILVSQRIRLTPNLASIIMGHPEIQYLEIKRTHGKLVNTGSELNIQFIIDAFSPKQASSTDEKESFSMGIEQVLFEDIKFEYQSEPDSIQIDLGLTSFEIEDFGLSTLPGRIGLESITLEQLALNVLSTGTKTPSDTTFSLPPLDFGTGFEFAINLLELNDNSLSFHSGGIQKTKKFDPNHLELDSIQLQIADIIIREDSLSLDLQQFSTNLGLLGRVDLRSEMGVGLTQAQIPRLQLSTDSSQITLGFSGEYGSWPDLVQDHLTMKMALETEGTVHFPDISYFLPDSILSSIRNWTNISFGLSVQNAGQAILIEKFNLVTGKSQLNAEGTISNIDVPDSIRWEQVELNIAAGPEFENLIKPYLTNLQVPSNLQAEIMSTGKLSLFEVQSDLRSADGNAAISGTIGIDNRVFDLQELTINGQKIALGKILNMPWLGSVDFLMKGNGIAGDEFDLSVSGRIDKIGINGHELTEIDISGIYLGDAAAVKIKINDPRYFFDLQSELGLGETLKVETNAEFKEFNAGRLLGLDSTLVISGVIGSNIGISPSTLDASVNGSEILLQNDSINYPIDALTLDAFFSTESSSLDLQSDNLETSLEANFDIRTAPGLITSLLENAGQTINPGAGASQNRQFKFDFQLDTDQPLKVLSSSIDHASDLHVEGLFEEKDRVFEISANTGKFVGFGFSIDSLGANLNLNRGEITSDMLVDNIQYDTLNLGNIILHVSSEDSTSAYSTFSLAKDSLTLFKTSARVKPSPGEVTVYVDSLVIFNEDLSIDQNNPITFIPQNILFDRYNIKDDQMNIRINGDLQEFELFISNFDLKNLNPLLSTDSSLISNGNLNTLFAFVKADQKLNLQATIDSLKFKGVPPIDLSARAITENGHIPVTFSLNSATNNIHLTGDYHQESSGIDGKITLELDDLGMFRFLLRDKLERASGKVNGYLDIGGTLQSPRYNGQIGFKDVDITTLNPRSTFHLTDESLTLNNSGVVLENFIILDEQQNPLRLDGSLITEDYKEFDYDFTVKADNYMLINNPEQKDYQLQGILVIGSDIKVSGNKKDLEVTAELVVRDTTSLTYVMPQTDLELLTDEGIVEFVNPQDPADTLSETPIQTMYDSVISSLPIFDLNTSIKLEEKALLRILLDANSGDYIEATGSANLKYTLDRTRNAELVGDYTIKSGFYQLSFYDLVKKKFTITEGSTVKWSGNPNKGVLDIKATYSIKTSSVGLIGHEIGENEKALYRRALPYEVGIIIGGDLEAPEVSFSLDLPQEEKINFPALSNKLSRLKQPEFESELNKQVFGLLVLGGFIPESGGSAFDEQLIATTALSNSVNSILASQLNRFASQMIKGVDIDVGLQSYSDYGATGSGQTRTAMDFRVTKRLMDDRLSIEVGGGVDINSDQPGSYAGSDNFRGDIAVIYDLTESGNKQLKVFNNETYDIIYHEIRNTGVSLIFIREFDKKEEEQPEP